MKLLFFGDVNGEPGLTAVAETLPRWRKTHRPDLIIANAENSGPRGGATVETIRRLQVAGVDAFTMGDHYRDAGFSGLVDFPITRPANLSNTANLPGVGWRMVETGQGTRLALINLLGHVFMPIVQGTNFFEAADGLLEAVEAENPDAILVDFHADATSETVSLAQYLDGRVSAVVGTHTHVPTADTRILPGGTALQTDVGFCGALHSTIGAEPIRSQAWMRQQMGQDVPVPPRRDLPPPYVCDAVLIETDGPRSAKTIRRLTSRPQ